MTEEAHNNATEDKPIDLWLELQKMKQNVIGYPLMLFISAFSLWGIALDSSSRTGLVWLWGLVALGGIAGTFLESRARVNRIEQTIIKRLDLSPAKVR